MNPPTSGIHIQIGRQADCVLKKTLFLVGLPIQETGNVSVATKKEKVAVENEWPNIVSSRLIALLRVDVVLHMLSYGALQR